MVEDWLATRKSLPVHEKEALLQRLIFLRKKGSTVITDECFGAINCGIVIYHKMALLLAVLRTITTSWSVSRTEFSNVWPVKEDKKDGQD